MESCKTIVSSPARRTNTVKQWSYSVTVHLCFSKTTLGMMPAVAQMKNKLIHGRWPANNTLSIVIQAYPPPHKVRAAWGPMLTHHPITNLRQRNDEINWKRLNRNFMFSILLYNGYEYYLRISC